MFCPAHDILLAHMFWHLKCVQTWVGIRSSGDPCTFPQSHSITLIQCTLHPVWHNPFDPRPPHKLKYGGYWCLSWRTGGSEDDNEKLDDLRVPPCRLLSVSLRPLTLSSAFDQLQVQPRLWYPSLFAQTCHLPASEWLSAHRHLLTFTSRWFCGVGFWKCSRCGAV